MDEISKQFYYMQHVINKKRNPSRLKIFMGRPVTVEWFILGLIAFFIVSLMVERY